MPVNATHKDYDKNRYIWQLTSDACEGANAIKTARSFSSGESSSHGPDIASLAAEPGTLYLPAPNATDISKENKERYRAYLRRAVYVNFTGSTLDAYLGMVYRKPPVIEAPDPMEPFIKNANGKGESLEDMTKRSVEAGCKAGREGLLMDYPVMPSASLTLAQTQGILPFMREYPSKSILNWRTDYKYGQERVTLVVLQEEIEKVSEDGFETSCEEQYRVLKLTDDDIYIQELYDKDGELLGRENEEGEFESAIVPRDGFGNFFNEIPFVFLGTVNNDSKPDKPLLYDMAEINIAHYRNSADYEEASFIVGQPTLILIGVDQAWIEDVLKGKVEIGSRASIPLPSGGSAILLQAAPNSMPKEAMEMKEKQLIQIGAKLITDQGQAETATSAKIRFAGQSSKLANLVRNVEQAYQKMLDYAMRFMGVTGESDIEINKDFYEKTLDPQMVQAYAMLMDRSLLARSDMWRNLRNGGIIAEDRTDEQLEAEIGDMSPLI